MTYISLCKLYIQIKNMGPIPLPSHIHYELLLQLLERQTLYALKPGTPQYSQAQNVVIQLRKALVHQKQLEESCSQAGVEIEHRWSLNQVDLPGREKAEGKGLEGEEG
jgi:hypothetical protein